MFNIASSYLTGRLTKRPQKRKSHDSLNAIVGFYLRNSSRSKKKKLFWLLSVTCILYISLENESFLLCSLIVTDDTKCQTEKRTKHQFNLQPAELQIDGKCPSTTTTERKQNTSICEKRHTAVVKTFRSTSFESDTCFLPSEALFVVVQTYCRLVDAASR